MTALLKSLLRNLRRPPRATAKARTTADLLSEARERFLAHDISAAQLGCEAVLDADPENADALQLLGLMAQRLRDLDSALDYFERAARTRTGHAAAWNNLGSVLTEVGRAEDAQAAFRRALAIDPESTAAHENLLFASNLLPERPAQAVLAEHRAWAAKHADPLTERAVRGARASAAGAALDPERRLRLGYVSADFRQHALACFIEPLLAGHRRDAYEVCCYSASEVEDEVTRRMRGAADRWCSIAQMDDDAAAARVRADEVDLLIDLSGHTRGNRLMLFARKPAPVQISYLGYLCTTGMAAMDYRISDAHADPPGASDERHTEALLRLPQSLWCYLPPADAPEPTPLPALRRGHVTFGSFNNVAKLSPQVLALWAQLLRRLPRARLALMAVSSEAAAARIREGLPGIEAQRIGFLGRVERARYWAQFAEVDIALDSFPYAGGTTTCDSLWMGVPVVSLAGASGFSRSGVTILNNARMEDCVAANGEAYLATALRLAADLPALAARRARLRGQLRTAPLTDCARYIRDLEQAYRDAWRASCARREQAMHRGAPRP